MNWGIKDVLSMSDYRREHFWGDLFGDGTHGNWMNGYSDTRKEKDIRALNIATYMVTRAMELAWQEMVNEGTEICFMTKKRNPFLIFFIKDFKYVYKFYKYNMKFRGNNNKFATYLYPATRKRMNLQKMKTRLQYFLYLDISLAVQRKGMDYPAMPDWNVYREMRKPYHDIGHFKINNETAE